MQRESLDPGPVPALPIALVTSKYVDIVIGLRLEIDRRGVWPRQRMGRPLSEATAMRSSSFFCLPNILWEHRIVAQKETVYRIRWTNEDVRKLKAHSKARTPLSVIAKKMNRTEGALRRKAGILGIGLGHHRPRG